LVDGDARVVDEDVQTAVGGHDLVDGAPAVPGLGDVALVDAHRGAVGGGEGVAELGSGLVVAGVAGGEHRALAGQAAGDGRADAAGAAGDEGHPALELVAGAGADVVVVAVVEDAHVFPPGPAGRAGARGARRPAPDHAVLRRRSRSSNGYSGRRRFRYWNSR